LELRDERLEVLLIEIKWCDEEDGPKNDGTNNTVPLMAPYGPKHLVIVFRQRVYLFNLSF